MASNSHPTLHLKDRLQQFHLQLCLAFYLFPEEVLMGFCTSVYSWFLISALLLTSGVEFTAADETFSVSDYGAVGDGHTDDSSAFTKAWTDACNTQGGTSTIDVPQGKYFLKPVKFSGPCNSNISLKVSGKIRAPYDPNAWKGQDQSKWLTFQSVNGLTISGSGLFDGNGNAWWNISCRLNPKPGCNMLAPTMLRFDSCDGVNMQNVHFKNSPQTHITISGSHRVHLKNLTISAPEWSPNTDGIHIQSSKVVSVQASVIGTGDDCISIGDQTSNINITHIDCGPGHGISIGSLGRSGNEVSVKNINVSHVNFQGSTNGARIKTWQVGKGQVSQVTFSNLNFTKVENPIIIDQYYCETQYGCSSTKSGVQISNVLYQMAFGTSSTKLAINLNCSNNVACTNINLDTVELNSANGGEEPMSSCNNAFGTAKGNVKPKSCLQ